MYQYTITRKIYENLWNDHQREDALISEQFLSSNSLRKCMEISLENLYVDIGASPVLPPLLCQPLFLNQQSGHSWHNLKTKNHKLRSKFWGGVMKFLRCDIVRKVMQQNNALRIWVRVKFWMTAWSSFTTIFWKHNLGYITIYTTKLTVKKLLFSPCHCYILNLKIVHNKSPKRYVPSLLHSHF